MDPRCTVFILLKQDQGHALKLQEPARCLSLSPLSRWTTSVVVVKLTIKPNSRKQLINFLEIHRHAGQ